jgi:ABC-type phosphate transport system substrate-binding protein
MLNRCIRLAVIAVLWLGSAARAADVVVVANNMTDTDDLSRETVRDIFLGKKTSWANGVKIIPVVLQDEAVHAAFLKAIIKKTPSSFSAYWNQILFTGKGIPPRIFENEKELIQFIAITRGAIGYVSGHADISGVKAIKVIK